MIIPGKLDLEIRRTVSFDGAQFQVLDEEDAPKDLTGYTAHAQVRKTPAGTVVLDLTPAVTNAVAGEVTIPAIADEDTDALPLGGFYWDLILEDAGARRGPYLAGKFKISDPVTQPA